jgi:biotin carboxyl carrier protein
MASSNYSKKKEKFIACSTKNKKFEIISPLDDALKVKGKKMNIEVVEEPEGFTYLIFKQKKFLVEILEKDQNKYTVMINGVWYEFSIETPISYKRRKTLTKKGAESKTELINAPMPGKILDVLIEENSDIKQGESLLILEAMKMQNEIVSPVSGKIIKINVRQNDSVMKDDVLVEIQKS